MAFTLKPHSANPYAGRYANHDDINLYFGFPVGAKVPREFQGRMQLPIQSINGEHIGGTISTPVVYGPGAPMRMGRFGRMIKSSKHRVYVLCLDCWEWVPAGRVHQHKCKKGK
jgi:hypothetical protein